MPIVTHPKLPGAGYIDYSFITRTKEHVGEDCSAILRMMHVGGETCPLCGADCGDTGYGIYANDAHRDGKEGAFHYIGHNVCCLCAHLPSEKLRRCILAMAKEEMDGVEKFVKRIKITRRKDGKERPSYPTSEWNPITLDLNRAADLIAACSGEIVMDKPRPRKTRARRKGVAA